MAPLEIRPGIRRLFHLALRRRDVLRAEMDEEIRLHLQLRAQQLESEGLAPDVARREAERLFGPIDEARERLHGSAERREGRVRLRESLESGARLLRVTLRGMRRSPGFVATAVTCIALGVGANAAAFSLFDELLLRPLPVHEPQQLVNLGAPGPKPGNDRCNIAGSCEEVFSYPMVGDLARAKLPLAGVAAHRLFLANLAVGDRVSDGDGVFVSGTYFPLLGIRPALGRLFGPADDVTPGAHDVAVLSHAYWSAQLGADPEVVGKRIIVNDRPLTVVGIAPQGFHGTTLGVRPRVFVPITMAPDVDPFFGSREDWANRRNYWVYAFARLAPGITIERARAELNTVYRGILAEVEAPLQDGLSPATKQRFLAKEVTVEPGSGGQSSLRGTTRLPLQLLFAITGLVVLIACANIANLLLVRGAGRATEIAVRMSLGAGRRQLVTQLLVESVVLAVLGGLASLLVARGTLALIGSFIPPATLGFGASLALEIRPSVLAFAAAVSLGTGLLFGLFPALHGTRPDLVTAIRSGAGQIAGGQRSATRARSALVTAQIALSMALLASAGMFIKSLRNVSQVNLGMDAERVVSFGLLPELSGYDATRASALFARVEQELMTIPGVTAASGSAVPLFTGSNWGNNVRVEGFARGPDTDANTRVNKVGPAFFRTLGIPLVAGREFSPADRLGAPKVAIVTEAFARKFGLGRDAVGKRMAVDGESPASGLDIEIVGIAADAAYNDVKREPPSLVYFPHLQDSTIGGMAFYARSSGAMEPVLRAVPATIARLDRTLPVALLKPLSQQVKENVYLDRMIGTLSAGFAALATLLAAVGLYGVLAYTVAQRTREIGVRMALGASAGSVRGLVLRQVGRLVVVGSAIGIAAALGAGRLTSSLLYGVEANDPIVVVAAGTVLALAALAAGYLPAWRASRVSPVTALRGD